MAVLFVLPTPSNGLPLRAFLRQETGKTRMGQREGSSVANAHVEYGVWPTLAAQIRAMDLGAIVICHATDRHFLVIKTK